SGPSTNSRRRWRRISWWQRRRAPGPKTSSGGARRWRANASPSATPPLNSSRGRRPAMARPPRSSATAPLPRTPITGTEPASAPGRRLAVHDPPAAVGFAAGIAAADELASVDGDGVDEIAAAEVVGLAVRADDDRAGVARITLPDARGADPADLE